MTCKVLLQVQGRLFLREQIRIPLPQANLELVTTSNQGKVKVKTAGLVRIDVNLIISVLTANTDITVTVYQEDTGTSQIQNIVREHSPVNKTAIGFSLFHVAAENDMYYYDNRGK